MTLAITLLATMDLLVKLLSGKFSTVQIVWTRYVMQTVTLVAMTGVGGIMLCMRSRQTGFHFSRSLLLLVGNVSFMLALRYLPLTEANAIAFTLPLFIATLSYPILGERVSTVGWLAVAIGFAGVLIVMRPGSAIFQWAALLPLAMAFAAALYHVTTPLVGRNEDPAISLHLLSVIGAIGLSFAVPTFWTAPDPFELAGLLSIGVLGAVGQTLIIRALALAPAAALAPLFYLYILWAIIFGFVFFGDLPNGSTLFGAALVVASGFYLYRSA